MFDPTFSVLNWLLYQGGFITTVPFLSDGTYGMWAATGQHLARHALLRHHAPRRPPDHQAGPPQAAALDGANGWHRFWHVTWPLLKPVTLVVVVFSVIQTFSDFQLIYVLTGGGPANSTHLIATYAYQISVGSGLLAKAPHFRSSCFPSSSSSSGPS